MAPPRPKSPLFPYTTLFRSYRSQAPSTRIRLDLDEHLQGIEADRGRLRQDRKSTRLNSSHEWSSYAVFCLKKKNGPPGAIEDRFRRVRGHRARGTCKREFVD